jgi:phosphate transport system substrate-binding protein
MRAKEKSMPANDGGHDRRPYRAPTRTITAAAITILALTACTSATTSPSAQSVAVASGSAITLTGSGSTFDAPFFNLAFARYHQAHPAVTISYSPVGSSAGIAAFTARQADFGASDVPMTSAEQAAAQGGPAVQVPVDLGAEVIAYNLLSQVQLHPTGPVIAAIYLGQITHWNDPAITALNPGTDLPDQPITVVHRSDGSGTTYIFSNYLSAVDPAWASRVGTGKTLHWPAGIGEAGNLGVSDAVAHIPFSIVNQPGAGSYPICGYSWALIYTHQASQSTGQALVSLLDWLTHAGQAYAATLGYVPLPPQIQQLAHTMLQQVTGPAGQPLTS